MLSLSCNIDDFNSFICRREICWCKDTKQQHGFNTVCLDLWHFLHAMPLSTLVYKWKLLRQLNNMLVGRVWGDEEIESKVLPTFSPTSCCFLMLVSRVSFATILLASSSFKASAFVNSWSCRPSSACRKACWETNEESDGELGRELSSHSAGCSEPLVTWKKKKKLLSTKQVRTTNSLYLAK